MVAVGLPGSGKSRFFELHLEETGAAVRCCQDVLKKKERVEEAVKEALAEGNVAYVDRTNYDPAQRKPYVGIAKRRGARVVALRFGASAQVCIARCNAHAALGVSTGVARTPAKNRRRAGVGNSVVGLKDGARVPCFYSVGDFTQKTSARARKQHIDWL